MRRGLVLLAGACTLMSVGDARAATSANLLADPGAEAGLYDAWTTAGGFVHEQYGAEFRPPVSSGQAIGGGANVMAGGSETSASSATQVVDVGGRAASIDAGGETATLNGFLGGIDAERDFATVTATFLPGGTAVMIGPVTPAERGNQSVLLARTASAPVPAGTRSVRVVVAATRLDGTYTDGYADELSLTLGTAASPSPPPTTTPTPQPGPPTTTTTTRRKGRVKGIKSPGRRVKGQLSVAGAACKSGRRVVVTKGAKTLGKGRTGSSGAFTVKTKKHKKGKLTLKIRSKRTSSVVCQALTKQVPGRN